MSTKQIIDLPPIVAPTADGPRPGGWWHSVDDAGRAICDLCPRACQLKPGDRGFCFVRQNLDGQMVLTTYGRSTGFCIDPIEKKPLNHFYPGTSVLSFGTAGCNLGCKFCQNHDISKAREIERASEFAGPETIAQAAQKLGCRSVAFTYNDPIIWAEYAIDTARACRELGIKTVAVTAGYITPQARGPFFDAFDAANVDLKAFTEDFYQHLTLSHLQPVLETLAWLKQESDVWLEITNLIIPGENDDSDELRRLCDWVVEHLGREVPVHFTAFHPDFKMLSHAATPAETLVQARAIALEAGIRYAYVGNVNDVVHQSTYCPACQALLIERNWYELGTYALKGNQCRACGQLVPGHFDDSPGSWGRRRQPVRIADFAPQDASQHRSDRLTRQGISPMSQPPRAESQESAKGAGERTGADLEQHGQVAAIELTDQQKQQIHLAACQHLAAAVTGQSLSLADPGLAQAANLPVMGAYVSAKRAGRLRGCCGFLGSPTRLAEAVELAAQRTALEDTRMPQISPSELPYLEIEVWLLQGQIPVKARGPERVDEIVIGRDGLFIQQGAQRGLLLPGVATDLGLDAADFLKQVCLKAGLPPTAWKDDGTTLFRFEGQSIRAAFSTAVESQTSRDLPTLLDSSQFQRLVEFCRENIALHLRGAVPNYYLPEVQDGMIYGVAVTVTSARHEPLHVTQVSLRPPLPMQSTVFALSQSAARVLQRMNIGHDALDTFHIDLTLMDDPAMHGTDREPDLRGVETTRRALLLLTGQKSAWRIDPRQSPDSQLQQLREELQFQSHEVASVYSMRTMSSASQLQFLSMPRPQTGRAVRPPAVAGSFYPQQPAEVDAALDELFQDAAAASERQSCRAAMVPHAGWRFSGQIAAKVLSSIQIPETVIILSPKHTRAGMNWAVAPQREWQIPGAHVAADQALAARLCHAIPQLELDAAAHEREHGIEVELPLIHRLAPQAKVVGITIGAATWPECQQFAAGLKQVLDACEQAPLLLISSDMNHFATDRENRRLDRLALDALQTLDPQQLLEVVRANDISMCGVLPAVIVMETLRQIRPLQSAREVAYATSADVTGDASRVVGYAGVILN